MNRMLYLGTCVFQPLPYTRVEAVAVIENGAWRTYDHFKMALPHEGRAFSPNLQGFGIGQYLAFGVVKNERGDADRDQFLVASPVLVGEVLDFRDHDTESTRRALVEEGVSSLLTGSDKVVVALPGSVCTVVRMVRHPTAKVFVADRNGLEHLPIYAMDERIFNGDEVAGHWIEAPGRTVGRRVGSLNWCSDADFLEWVMKRLRKSADASPVARAQIPAVVSYLCRAQLLPAAGEDLSQSIARLRRIAPELAANHGAVEEMVAILSSLEPVNEALQARRAEMREGLRVELEPQVRAELKKGLADLTSRSAELLAENARLEAAAAEAEAAGASATAASRALGRRHRRKRHRRSGLGHHRS
jgi:hypothetical protein